MLSGPLRHAWADTLLSYLAFLRQPGRLLRYGGFPMLLAIGAVLEITLNRPLPEIASEADTYLMQAWLEANGPVLLIAALLLLWANIRILAQSMRWGATGEDGLGLLEPGFGGRELRLLGWSVLLWLGLVPLLLFALNLAQILGLAGLLLGYLPVVWLMGRVLPGLVPVALGQPAAIGPGFRASGRLALYPAAFMFLAILPDPLLTTLPRPEGVVGVVVLVLVSLLGFLIAGVVGLAAARIWDLSGRPKAEQQA